MIKVGLHGFREALLHLYPNPRVHTAHIDHGVSEGCQAYFSLKDVVMMDNPLSQFKKLTYGRQFCSPTVLHGMDSIPINKTELAKLEAFQGQCIRSVWVDPIIPIFYLHWILVCLHYCGQYHCTL